MKFIGFLITIAAIAAGSALAMDIESDVFENKGFIPDRYTCDAQNYSPSLFWKNVPAKTESFVLICDDPDAPFKTWVHWLLFNIPGSFREIRENISAKELAEEGVSAGINDFGKLGYGGPCPPAGKYHRYFFKLYALDTALSLEEGATKKEIIRAMQSHILAESRLIGLYQRPD